MNISDFNCSIGDSSLADVCTLFLNTAQYHAKQHLINQEDLLDFFQKITHTKNNGPVVFGCCFDITSIESIATAMADYSLEFDALGRTTLDEYSLVLPLPRSNQTLEKLMEFMILHYHNYYDSPVVCCVSAKESSLKLSCYINGTGVLGKFKRGETMPTWMSYALGLLYGEDTKENSNHMVCSFTSFFAKSKPLPSTDA